MKPILVPHDFTEVGAYALEHAYMIGKTHNNPINVIHIVSKSDAFLSAAACGIYDILILPAAA